MLAGVCFRRTTEMLKLSHFFFLQLCISLGSVFKVILWQHCVYPGLRHNKQSVRDWKRQFFWLKTPFFGQHKPCWSCPAVTLPDLAAQSRTVVIGLATLCQANDPPAGLLPHMNEERIDNIVSCCGTWWAFKYIWCMFKIFKLKCKFLTHNYNPWVYTLNKILLDFMSLNPQ